MINQGMVYINVVVNEEDNIIKSAGRACISKSVVVGGSLVLHNCYLI